MNGEVDRSDDRARAALSAAVHVLAKCAANDPTIPKPNKATAAAWAEHILEAGLQHSADLLLAAVTRVYATAHSDGFRLRPWHVIAAARELREEAAMREPAARRQARQDARDAAIDAAEAGIERAAVADGMVLIPRGTSPYIVACHHEPCRAAPGRPCQSPGGRLVYGRAHPNRIERAAEERAWIDPHARQVAAEAVRRDALHAISRYHERHRRTAQ